MTPSERQHRIHEWKVAISRGNIDIAKSIAKELQTAVMVPEPHPATDTNPPPLPVETGVINEPVVQENIHENSSPIESLVPTETPLVAV